MHIALESDIRKIEEIAVRDYGIPMLLLMEQAGAAVARCVLAHLSGKKKPIVMIVCGTGNNGGDGLAAARHLQAAGLDLKVFVYGNPEKAADLTKMYLEIIRRTGISISVLNSEPVFLHFSQQAMTVDLIVDALMGIGFKPPLASGMEKVINVINASRVPVVAIDIPSGIECDSAQAKTAVRARDTVAMILPKPAHYLEPGASLSGHILVDGLSLPDKLLSGATNMQTVDEDLAASLIRLRDRNSHKGVFGKVLITAGSNRYPGAAVLAAKGAVRSGAGLVYMLDYGHSSMAGSFPEVLPAIELLGPGELLNANHVLKVLGLINHVSALVMGPGLSDNPVNAEAVRTTVQMWKGPVVLDADALNAFHGQTDLLREAAGLLVITPHPGEMARLLDISVNDVQSNRIQTARKAAEMWKCTVALKGAGTVVAGESGAVYINTTGNPGMAAGGSGDVLAGLIGGLSGQGYDPLSAAALGVYIHGKAGDCAAGSMGPLGFTPSETADFIPSVFKSLFRKKQAGKESEHAEENTKTFY